MRRIETAASILFIAGFTIILVAVTFPGFQSVSSGRETRSQRIAQSIASVYNAAAQAGVDFGDRDNPRSIAELLQQGVDGTGAFRTATFQIDCTPEQIDLAEPLLTYDHQNRRMGVRRPTP